ncbi:MAG: neutral/alkaline non-lysosomal ceramidase N-terminal domain-containing protein, partial [Tannerella sp.]|nr:neutral/alkaline non-lysosomal ceramidase N-terminal domain-containing protein [Tannerella sp.]
MKTKYCIIALLCICFAAFFTADAQSAGRLTAGSAKINITPPQTRYPVHDSLYARSLILDDGENRIAFIAYDSGGGSDQFIESIKKKYNLKELYLCQSHNHSGASGAREWTEEKFTALIDQASKNMFEAKISGGHRSFPQLSFNRLIVRDDGHARESWFADDHYRYINRERLSHGPVDNSVGVIRIEDLNGNPRILIMNYACHPDVVWNNFEVSADFVGYATRYTEEAFDNKIHCLFINGAAGNQAPIFKDG